MIKRVREVVELVEILLKDVTVLDKTLEKIEKSINKISQLSVNHQLSSKDLLIAIVSGDKREVGFELYDAVIEAHELQKRIGDVRGMIINLETMLQKLKGVVNRFMRYPVRMV